MKKWWMTSKSRKDFFTNEMKLKLKNIKVSIQRAEASVLAEKVRQERLSKQLKYCLDSKKFHIAKKINNVKLRSKKRENSLTISLNELLHQQKIIGEAFVKLKKIDKNGIQRHVDDSVTSILEDFVVGYCLGDLSKYDNAFKW